MAELAWDELGRLVELELDELGATLTLWGHELGSFWTVEPDRSPRARVSDAQAQLLVIADLVRRGKTK